MDNFVVMFGVLTCVMMYGIYTIMLKLGRWRQFYKQASKFPGPPTLPIIGNAHLFTGGTEAVWSKFLEMSTVYPTPYRFWIGNCLVFVINTPEQLKAALLSTKIMEKGDLYGFIRPWLGSGLLTSSGVEWQQHRKFMQPTFSSAILKTFVKIFFAQSQILAKEMEQHLDGKEFDIYEYISQFTLRTICGTTMGVNLGKEANSDGRYSKAITNVIASVCERVRSPWLHPNFIFERTQLGKDLNKDIKFLHNFTNNVIQTKRKKLLKRSHQPQPAKNEEDKGDWDSRRKVLLDHLLDLAHEGTILSDESLRDEVDTIMVAGSDTTAVTVSFVMLMLASHPTIQEKVYEELYEIYGDDDIEERHITQEDLPRMTYLERVIKETMRLFPVSPTLIRYVPEDFIIGEDTLPAGSFIFLSLIDVHRNGDYWPDALKFDPDRFLPEEVAKRNAWAYLPFSGGLRNCIGSKYAMMSMKTVSATVLRRYILKKDNIIPPKDIRIKWEFLLRSVDPITIRIEKRSGKVASI